MLSRGVYKSFDKDSAETTVNEQPFKDYQCKKSIGGMFYTYSEGEYVGLIDSAGNVVIKADKIYDITAVSGDLIACYSDKEHKKPSDYYYVTSRQQHHRLQSKCHNRERPYRTGTGNTRTGTEVHTGH